MAAAQNGSTEKKAIVAALGIFDGVHLGHRSVIAHAASMGICHAVTFAADSMPLKKGHPIRYIYDDEQKRRLLTACGADAVFALPFGEMQDLDGLAFCRDILREQLQVNVVVCGEDYRFGRGGACTAEDLVRFGKQLGFQTELIPRVTDDEGLTISSSHIRFLLESGEIGAANHLLGADYTILTQVVEGNHLGTKMGFPTANQEFQSWQCIPRAGVYASYASINDLWVPAITNIGVRPTIGEENAMPLAETHLLDWNGDLRGRLLPVTLCRYLRPERKFENLDALTVQMQRDTAQRRKMLGDNAL